jgi:hypothetical protein
MSRSADKPRLVRPLISAAAMLPPPMNASFLMLFKNPPLFDGVNGLA